MADVGAGTTSWSPTAGFAAAAAGSTAAPLAYLLGYNHAGLHPALATAALVVVAANVIERRLTSRSRWSAAGLVSVAASAALVLVTGEEMLFFLRSVLGRGLWGAIFVATALAGRPAVGALLGWMLPPDRGAELLSHRAELSRVTFVWGCAELAKAALRGYAMATGSLETFTIVLVVTGWPVEAVLLAWSVAHLRRRGLTLRPLGAHAA